MQKKGRHILCTGEEGLKMTGSSCETEKQKNFVTFAVKENRAPTWMFAPGRRKPSLRLCIIEYTLEIKVAVNEPLLSGI